MVMTQKRWQEVQAKFDEVVKQLDGLRAEIKAEFGEHRDQEYLSDRQLERASEHIWDAQEHWRKIDIF
jgi:hypothetical protein